MNSQAPDRLAQEIMAHLVGDQEDPWDLADAASSICSGLSYVLEQFVGPKGCRAILMHSLAVIQKYYSLPQPLSIGGNEAAHRERLAEVLQGLAPDSRRGLVASLVYSLIEVMGDLLGTELTLNLVIEAWPEIDWRE